MPGMNTETSADEDLRPGEVVLPSDPSGWDDARLTFIGRVESPWTHRADCPKNVREARERHRPAAAIAVVPTWRAAIAPLAPGDWVHVLTWLHGARRDLAVQVPRHLGSPRGTFALRSPVRPNPIGLHLVRIVALDAKAGRILIDAIDALDGTPVLDLKPYLPGVDAPPAAEPIPAGARG